MSNILYTLTPLAETVGYWRFRDNLKASTLIRHFKTLPTLDRTVGHWRFQDSLVDISGRGHDLTAQGGLSAVDYGLGYTEAGNTIITTDGTKYANRAAGSDSSYFDMGRSSFTIEVIAKTPAPSALTSFVEKTDWGSPAKGWALGIRSSSPPNVCRIHVGDGINEVSANGSSVITNNRWHHIVWAVDRASKVMTLYIDGIADPSITNIDISSIVGGISDNTQPLEIGPPTHVGDIDEICITRKSLTVEEVRSRYSGSFAQASHSERANSLSPVGISSGDFTTGYTEPGNTVIDFSPGTLTKYAHLVDYNAIDFDMYMSSFSFEAILKVQVHPTNYSLIFSKGSWAANEGWYVSMTPDVNDIGFILLQGGTSPQLNARGAAGIADNAWHYLAITVDRGEAELKFYVDGSLDTTIDLSSTPISGSIAYPEKEMFIGQYLNGFLDEVCVTKRVLTASEIAMRALGHGDPLIIEYSGSTDATTNVVDTTLDSFDIQLKHVCNHVLSTGYFTLETCPRCSGTGFYYDIKFDAIGRPPLLRIEDKLIQSLEKMVLTSENKFHENLVVGVHTKLGEWVDDVEGIIKYDLIQAVATLKNNQRGVTNLSSRAQIARLDNVVVIRTDETTLRYIVEITTVAGEQVELSGTIHISGQ